MATSGTTLLASPPSSSVCGQNVTFTATVTPATGGPPTGTVDFVISADGPTVTAPVIATGTSAVASVTVGNLSISPPSHSVIALYSGDDTVDPSTSNQVSQAVSKASSTTTLSAPPSVCGQPVICTATVVALCPSAGIPTGSVLFTVAGAPPTSVTLVGGVARFTATPPVGSHTVTANYSGDGCFVASTSPALTQTVQGATGATALTAVPATIRLRSNGTLFIPALSATLTAAGAPVPGRTITFTAAPPPGRSPSAPLSPMPAVLPP